MDFIEYLKNVPIFSQLLEADLKKLENIAKERFYKKGALVISEGNKGEAIYIIKTGKVKIYKTSSDGREIILDIKDAGKIFAEVTLFNGGMNPATVAAIEDSVIYCINNNDIEMLIKNNPDMALEIIKVLNKRLQEAQAKIKNMALNDTYVRVSQMLLRLSEKYGDLKNGVIELNVNLTREELASLAGTSRETVSRILSQFSKEKILKISGRKITILDINKIKEWSI
ncbi:Crp/Fnr family transcriptional regulator [Brassicibacter mesophilus]|uniref:Crp/Fnr family transcriptional regulator n=1 Tax=Brassicibacter mesophilus TaxID=745119 RepID=UPI003D22B53A